MEAGIELVQPEVTNGLSVYGNPVVHHFDLLPLTQRQSGFSATIVQMQMRRG
jgi:hypothetical protein